MNIYKQVLKLAAPIAMHSVLFSSLGFIDAYMLAQLGGESVAAGSVGGRVMWVCFNIIIGLSGAVAILVAQGAGANSDKAIGQNLHLGMGFALLVATIVSPLLFYFASPIVSLISSDRQVILLAASYIEITAFTLFAGALSTLWGAGLRAIGKPQIALYLFLIELILNVTFNYLLIFGNAGFPALGIQGAAWGTLLAKSLSTLLLAVYVHRRIPLLKLNYTVMKRALTIGKIKQYWVLALPLIGGELVWSLGLSVYHSIYGHIDSTVLAAMAVLAPIEIIAASFSWGCAAATGVLISQTIGARNHAALSRYIRAGLICSLVAATVLVLSLWLSQGWIWRGLNQLEPAVLAQTESLFPLILTSILLRAMTMTMMSGVLKSGGDTTFTFWLDLIAQWVLAVPLSLCAAFLLDWPIEGIYAVVLLEEVTKLVPMFYRVKTGKWIKQLA
ncbi:MATE family efflux transporter [Thaumasiovibrio subtropicus]|uniref:MATE family efflux transporter n=1 Tax=Thaumasiovibrio subtropicus TaxID=1891207 RepID=UPI000B35E3AD|nr:MATE family efflux transporter [Thaumasiovibrio subtropicus]